MISVVACQFSKINERELGSTDKVNYWKSRFGCNVSKVELYPHELLKPILSSVSTKCHVKVDIILPTTIIHWIRTNNVGLLENGVTYLKVRTNALVTVKKGTSDFLNVQYQVANVAAKIISLIAETKKNPQNSPKTFSPENNIKIEMQLHIYCTELYLDRTLPQNPWPFRQNGSWHHKQGYNSF